MGGILERIFGRGGAGRGAPAPERLELGLQEVRAFVQRERDAKMRGFVQEAGGRMDAVLYEVRRIGGIAKEFAEKPVKVENPEHARIARQMKENYGSRLPKILAELRKPDGMGFDEIGEFHAGALKVLGQVTKITSDNRYLLFFFKAEFERLSEPVKALVAEVEALGALLEKNEPVERKAGEMVGKIGEMESAEKEMESTGLQINERERLLDELEGNLDIAAKARLAEEASELKERGEGIAAEAAHVRAEIAALLLPLERLFRKYEKAAPEKHRAAIAREYAENNYGKMKSEEGGLPELVQVCTEMFQLLEEGKLREEGKDRRKHAALLARVLQGEAASLMEKSREAEMRLQENRAQQEGKRRELGALEDLERQVDEGGKEMDNLRGKVDEKRGKIAKLRAELEKSISDFSVKEVKISD